MASWQDRIRDAKFIMGNGEVFQFEFISIPKTRKDRAVVFSFSEFSGDFVQKLSAGGDAYDLNIWFSGEDHDLISDKFDEATKDIRPVTFFHPLKKRPFKCQFLSIKRDDNIVEKANETGFKLSIHTTIDGRRPKGVENEAVAVESIKLESNESAAKSFEDIIAVKSSVGSGVAGQVATIPFSLDDSIFPMSQTKNELNNITETIATAFNDYYDNATDLLAEAEAVRLSAVNLVSILESTPKSASLVIRGYMGLVGKTTKNKDIVTPKSKIDFYKSIKENIIASDITNFEMVNASLIIGLCQSVISSDVSDFDKRSDVYGVVDTVYDWINEYIARIDLIIASDELQSYLPNLEAIKLMLDIATKTANKLDLIVLNSKQERSVIVNKDEDYYSLAYELYGAISDDDIEEKVNQLLLINAVRGTSIFLIEPGTEIVYYL